MASDQLPSLASGFSGESSEESVGSSTSGAGLTANTECVSESGLWLDGERALVDNVALRFSAGKQEQNSRPE